MKKLFILLFLISFSFYAQNTVVGNIEPASNFSWILLYKLENGKQEYVENATVENGKFEFKIAENEPKGIYRAFYQMENNLYVEFIYSKEDVEFSFNPNNPIETIEFSKSDDNKIYQKYNKYVTSQQRIIDSLQVVYFKSQDEKLDWQIKSNYQRYLEELKQAQIKFEDLSKEKVAFHFIKSSKQHYANSPFKDPNNYIEEVKKHFFDAIDFKDPVLRNSTFINDRLTDYVFYLNQANNTQSKNLLQKEAIKNAAEKIDADYILLKNFEETLLQRYLVEENTEMIYYVIEEYYNNLPVEYQEDALKYKIVAELKTAVGNQAPDFTWQENGVNKNLYSLIGSEYYILVFFSSGCPHCQDQIPKFYTFINEIENIRVVAVGLEDQKEDWEKMTANYTDFINVLDLNKWESKKVKDYGITGIPSYFVLDANKKILAKPNDLDELKAMFETR